MLALDYTLAPHGPLDKHELLDKANYHLLRPSPRPQPASLLVHVQLRNLTKVTTRRMLRVLALMSTQRHMLLSGRMTKVRRLFRDARPPLHSRETPKLALAAHVPAVVATIATWSLCLVAVASLLV